MPKLLGFLALFLFLPCFSFSAPSEPAIPEQNISVSFDIPASRLIGNSAIPVEAGKTLIFNVQDLTIKAVSVNGTALKPQAQDGKIQVTTTSAGRLEIQYEAVFKEKEGSVFEMGVSNMIGNKGIALVGNWYPAVGGLGRYRLTAFLPDGYEAVSEADRIEKVRKEGRLQFLFTFDHPVPGISLVAGNRYQVSNDRINETEISVYSLPGHGSEAKSFLQQAKQSIASCSKLFSPYPYKRLTVIETVLPSGLSRPSLILVGQDRSLPTEEGEWALASDIVQQWLGNSVYADIDKGNWTDGLTAYLGEHLYEDRAGRGWRYRKRLLIDYQAAVSRENEIALREFRGRTNRATAAVGRDKGAMVFHMLKRAVGDETFFDALRTISLTRRFELTGWEDIRTAFEKRSGKDLSAFFGQWLDRKGLPDLSVRNQSVKRTGDPFEVRLDVVQEEKPYNLDLPVSVHAATGGVKKELLKLDAATKGVTLQVDAEPRTIVMDEDYDIARQLWDSELPPVIATLLTDDKPVIAQPVSNRDAYAGIIAALKARGGHEKEAAAVTNEDVKDSNVAVLGNDNPVAERLFGKVEMPKAGFSVQVRENPWKTSGVAVLIDARSAPEAASAFPKLPAYPDATSLAFDQGRLVLRKTADSRQGMETELRASPQTVDLSALKTFDELLRGARDRRIIYVGEYHDKFAHHDVQLQVIRSLAEQHQKIAIGMEMFQRPFQKIVDDYINGAIGEREFLKRTEYFKRWVFDYNLYKPILDFARSRRIPVIALNQKKEITDKVAKSGLDSLTDEERKQVPRHMDFSDNEYRNRLEAVFNQHRSAGSDKNFDFFYQAQVLWDETMAMSIDEFLRQKPDHRMVVIAGSGHLAYGSGIPKRSFRRNELPYFIVLNDGDVDREIANYLVFPQALEGVTAPKMMAALDVRNKQVTVMELPPDSVSRQAGIRPGDLILTIDNEKVESVEDIKLALFYRQRGDMLKVRVLRKRFFLGDRQMEFDVKL